MVMRVIVLGFLVMKGKDDSSQNPNPKMEGSVFIVTRAFKKDCHERKKKMVEKGTEKSEHP